MCVPGSLKGYEFGMNATGDADATGTGYAFGQFICEQSAPGITACALSTQRAITIEQRCHLPEH
jgi:hypothetical protein